MNQKLQNAHNNVCDESASALFQYITKSKIKCVSAKTMKTYYFDNDAGLYTDKTIEELAMIIRTELRAYFASKDFQKEKKKISDEHISDFLKMHKKLSNKIGDLPFVTKTAKSYILSNVDETFENKLNSDPEAVNFKNGIYNLRTGKFRERTSEDLVSVCLEYNYSKKKNTATIKRIKDLLFNIHNNDDALLEFNLGWNGYCLTGYTDKQVFLCHIGESASNGKSTGSKMFQSAFSIYSKKINKNTFGLNCSNNHKHLIGIGKPIRYIIIEELDSKAQDSDLIKDFTDGNKIVVELLYSTTKDITIQGKINMNSNKIPNLPTDEGIKRRMKAQRYLNKFLEPADYEEGERNFKKDATLDSFIETEEFKLAYFHLIAPYAKLYCEKHELLQCDNIDRVSKEITNENDEMKAFIDSYYIITKNEKDRVSKDDFFSLYRSHKKTNMTPWISVLSDIKRMKGIEYKDTYRVNGKKGAIIGLREKTDFDNNNEESDNEDSESEESDNEESEDENEIARKVLKQTKRKTPKKAVKRNQSVENSTMLSFD